VQRGQRVDAAVERFVSFPGRFEPVADGMAAHEAGAHLLDGDLVEKLLLVGDSENGNSPEYTILRSKENSIPASQFVFPASPNHFVRSCQHIVWNR
jgi:hypothetical protein